MTAEVFERLKGGFRAGDIPPLPEAPKNRSHIGDDLQPVGDYADINPVHWLEEDVAFVQSAKADSAGMPEDEGFWWSEHRIQFLNGKAQVGLSAVILAVPYLWALAVVCGAFVPVFWLDSLEKPGELETILVFIAIGGWVFASLFYIIPKTIPWVMSVFGLLLLPFDKLLARLLDRTLESGKSEFNRRTGEVTFALGGGKTLMAPFVEFDTYVERVVQHGGIFYRLQFLHRYTGKRFSQTSLTRIEPTREEVLALWDMLQRYMDVSEPLPDIPRLEPYRHKDPVTAEQDRKTGRNPRYWRDLDLETWKQGEGADWARRQAAFPWDQRRCRLTPQLGKISMAAYRDKRASQDGAEVAV